MYFNLMGPDGSGKDTQRELLLPYFPDAILTREPGGTPEAEIIREIILNKDFSNDERLKLAMTLSESDKINETTKSLLNKAISELDNGTISGTAEMYLYAASRSESLENVVRPALANGQHVIGNRSVSCSVAYQGNARGLGMERVWNVNKPIVQSTYPDIEIFLDIPISTTMERLSKRTEKQDRLDVETEEFHKKSREGYLYYYENLCPYDYAIVDATGSVEDIHLMILDILRQYKKR